ncbi:hypothetical protein F3B23_09685 [Bacteroides fragilis]|uniref:Uncharacterized protein n=1 Tax=Bacteroides fragilis TaxID=817 RepID=A0A5M5WCK8_BACFG|nr:hypothetical protein F3B28_06405 [Bacteroides fragilis]KAA4708232.1 hypothetical protein F3B27_11590 [Bacteroides fragilis]KAA4720069.1 hypothetical protein F3B32_08800 [Bacteroides fragilis]KAA4731669.1 hypothetical protein F3B23_09685 [Bacteroides fragilis]KAA4732444.1 hypothetical protein F3B30_06335 [Bacteroides fragilis]
MRRRLQCLKDAGNDLVAKVLLWVTQFCIVSNNSYTNVGNIWNITKYMNPKLFSAIFVLFWHFRPFKAVTQ